MLERSVISILFASNSRRGSWWRNHGSGMVEMQTRMGEEGEERGDRRYLTVIFLRDRIWRGIIRRNLINRLDTILFSAQNVLDDEKDNARRILSNPDISSLN